MKNLLIFADQRLGEPSTWSALAALLTVLHFSVDPGIWHAVTLYGVLVAGVLGVMLAEIGTKPTSEVVLDGLRALIVGLKTLPTDVGKSGAAAIAVVMMAALGLSACAQAPQTTAAQVAVALTAADQVALRYVELPACGSSGAGGLCSDPATIARIKAAGQAAYTAVKAAEASGASGDLAMALAAVASLNAALPAPK